MQFHRAVTPFPDDWAIAMAYVPMQTDTTAYEPAQALCEGTLFVALNKPFKRGCAG
ncbi:MAG: spore coat associated protein CotJA [Clostridia bacterium]|nr:spore coat associated protein CotJA [Clostridia bacterium]